MISESMSEILILQNLNFKVCEVHIEDKDILMVT